jgi:hypothetical protein
MTHRKEVKRWKFGVYFAKLLQCGSARFGPKAIMMQPLILKLFVAVPMTAVMVMPGGQVLLLG